MPEGGAINVTAERGEDGKTAVIQFSDTGTGIAPEHLDQVFEEKYVENEFVLTLEASGFSHIDFSQLPEYKVV